MFVFGFRTLGFLFGCSLARNIQSKLGKLPFQSTTQCGLQHHQMALHEDDNQLRVDEHEHLLHGRVTISRDGDDEAGSVSTTRPLSRVQLALMHGSKTIGTTRMHADGSYTMLFTTRSISAKTKHTRKHPDVQLLVYDDEINPCKAMNITKRSSFASELLDVIQADRGVQDGLIWEQSLEIDFREAFPECAGTIPVPQSLTTRFQDLQADEFRVAVEELAEEVIGELPLPLAEAAVLLCYGIFVMLLCVLMRISRTRPTELKEPTSRCPSTRTSLSSYDQTMNKFDRLD